MQARLHGPVHGPLDDRPEGELAVRGDPPQQADVREDVLAETQNSWPPAAAGLAELVERQREEQRRLEVRVLVAVDHLQHLAPRVNDGAVLVVAFAVAEDRKARQLHAKARLPRGQLARALHDRAGRVDLRREVPPARGAVLLVDEGDLQPRAEGRQHRLGRGEHARVGPLGRVAEVRILLHRQDHLELGLHERDLLVLRQMRLLHPHQRLQGAGVRVANALDRAPQRLHPHRRPLAEPGLQVRGQLGDVPRGPVRAAGPGDALGEIGELLLVVLHEETQQLRRLVVREKRLPVVQDVLPVVRDEHGHRRR
mmetsp:Transcript_98280/g.300517  ORF Transcript_98280/g.300517 Transcript_98280/m.300517 type:complete len:311 (-) Transcript_98280:260-1192(-)